MTQRGDRDDDRPIVFADHGYLSGDSAPLLIARDRRTGMTFAAAVSMKGGGDPHAARFACEMDRWSGMSRSHCQNRRRAQHL